MFIIKIHLIVTENMNYFKKDPGLAYHVISFTEMQTILKNERAVMQVPSKGDS